MENAITEITKQSDKGQKIGDDTPLPQEEPGKPKTSFPDRPLRWESTPTD